MVCLFFVPFRLPTALSISLSLLTSSSAAASPMPTLTLKGGTLLAMATPEYPFLASLVAQVMCHPGRPSRGATSPTFPLCSLCSCRHSASAPSAATRRATASGSLRRRPLSPATFQERATKEEGSRGGRSVAGL